MKCIAYSRTEFWRNVYRSGQYLCVDTLLNRFVYTSIVTGLRNISHQYTRASCKITRQ